jgi:hypothetical protein
VFAGEWLEAGWEAGMLFAMVGAFASHSSFIIYSSFNIQYLLCVYPDFW